MNVVGKLLSGSLAMFFLRLLNLSHQETIEFSSVIHWTAIDIQKRKKRTPGFSFSLLTNATGSTKS